MNQILSTENNYKQKKIKNREPLDMRKIIIIFSIIVIVFALVIVGAKIVGMIKDKIEESENPITTLNKPSINIEKIESICKLEVSYDEGLNKIVYWWNDSDTIIEKNMNGSTNPFITQIAIPEGDNNILHVKATGIDGSSNEKTESFGTEITEDLNKPSISWYHYEGTTKMDIIAKSKVGIKELRYRWEDEEEIIEEATEENQKELKITIEAKRGNNKLYITAEDVNGNIQSKEGVIVGVLAPEINAVIENNKLLKITITHDKGFKKVIININNQEFIYDENNPQYNEETTELNINGEVQPGKVTVQVKVYTLEEPDKEYLYEAEGEITE